MSKMSRRSFVTQTATGAAAVAALGSSAAAQLVYHRSDWKVKEFEHLLSSSAKAKQAFDVTAISGGKFLGGIRNSLNGLEFGFGIPKGQIQIVAALHGAANLLNYDDYVWEKYRIGEWQNVSDPASGKPAQRNFFYPSKAGKELHYASQDPEHEDSLYQDTSIQALQARGVVFLSCHTGLEEIARALIKQWKLTQQREEVVKDMMAHALPGVLIVASMVAALALLQNQGHYAYTAV
jgi:intracellular sulfur oxidation DsrE/DsrF family protein